MQYLVSRTSTVYNDDIKPCDGAYKISVPYWDIRTCTEEHFDTVIAKKYSPFRKWREDGHSHCRVTLGHKSNPNGKYIARRLEDIEAWAIDFYTLDELDGFIAMHGECILGLSSDNLIDEARRTIEIYDRYRE